MAPPSVKVCLIQDYLPPYRIPLFTKVAQADGVDFTLLLTARGHANYQQWEDLWRDPPFKCVLVPGWRFRLKSDTDSGFNPALFGALLRRRPDVVICSGFSLNTILAIAYKLLFGKRVVVWTEATATTESFLSYPRLRESIRRFLARFVDGFIDAGTQAREYAQHLLPKRRRAPFFRSYNAVDNDSFARRCEAFREDAAAFEAFRRRFAPRNILFSGQLIERKNVALMIDVYAEILRRTGEPVGLIVLGQGPLKEYLRERKRTEALDHLYLEGFQLAEEYCKYFAAADAFMLLSVYDCNPLVIFEALAAGLPTLCSKNAGNAADFIADGENGYVVDPADPDEIVSRALSILARSDRPAMAAAGRRLVAKANYDSASAAFVDAARAVMAPPAE
jgi:glycosyltransferase involved in cell wall biosynthesis